MNALAEQILSHLQQVKRLREAAPTGSALGAAVTAVKTFQARRFERCYADLLADPRRAPAARFFLTDLYGAGDFSRRDAEFERIVPALVRLFDAEIIETVAVLAALHALSEELDLEMARGLPTPVVDAAGYGQAWRRVGRAGDRQRQIDLTLRVGEDLRRLTRRRLLRQALHLMRKPARVAGLGTLQTFLENGFDTFAAMGDAAAGFLAAIREREAALAAALFAGEAQAAALRWLPDAPAAPA